MGEVDGWKFEHSHLNRIKGHAIRPIMVLEEQGERDAGVMGNCILKGSLHPRVE